MQATKGALDCHMNTSAKYRTFDDTTHVQPLGVMGHGNRRVECPQGTFVVSLIKLNEEEVEAALVELGREEPEGAKRRSACFYRLRDQIFNLTFIVELKDRSNRAVAGLLASVVEGQDH